MRSVRFLSLAGFALAVTSCSRYNSVLEDVYDRDQAVRQWVLDISNLSADEVLACNAQMAATDSVNQGTVSEILDREGWPSHLSEKANKALWIVIDHADIEFQRKYLSMVQAQAERGVVSASDYAVLQDRVLMHEGKPQRYGTQIKMSTVFVGDTLETNAYALWPVEDADKLDSLRNRVGLPPIDAFIEETEKTLGAKIDCSFH